MVQTGFIKYGNLCFNSHRQVSDSFLKQLKCQELASTGHYLVFSQWHKIWCYVNLFVLNCCFNWFLFAFLSLSTMYFVCKEKKSLNRIPGIQYLYNQTLKVKKKQ